MDIYVKVELQNCNGEINTAELSKIIVKAMNNTMEWQSCGMKDEPSCLRAKVYKVIETEPMDY